MIDPVRARVKSLVLIIKDVGSKLTYEPFSLDTPSKKINKEERRNLTKK
jgi:hypothetical protein